MLATRLEIAFMIGIDFIKRAVWMILAVANIAVYVSVALGQAPPTNVVASELPRPDYYIAKDLYDSGQIQDATEGFQSAFKRARQIGKQRWVDSIPPLVMLGECFYQQGSIAMALEQYDAALMLALAYPNWIDQLNVPMAALPVLNTGSRNVTWGASSRKFPLVAIPDATQIAVDPTAAQTLPNGGVVAPISMVTRLDVAEVLRTIGIALWRRAQYLGPLARHSPLADPLVQLFAKAPQQNVPWVSASWNVLHGLAMAGSREDQQSRAVLMLGSSIGEQYDYFLTPLALVALGQMDVNSSNPPAALTNLLDAAVIAAHFDQFDTLAESASLAAGIATATRRADLLPTFQGAIAWNQSRSRHAFVSISAAASELALAAGNVAAFDTLVKQTGTVLRQRQKQIAVPRVLAQASYVAAQFAFAQNNAAVGLENLDTALTLLRGNPRSGTAARYVFQTQMALDLVDKGALGILEGEQALSRLLAEPSSADWMMFPIECLTHITTSALPAYERWLEFAIRRGTKEEIVARMDRVQRQRLYEALPLGGRLYGWRQAAGGIHPILPPTVQAALQQAIQMNPAISNMAARMQKLITELNQQPMAVDDKQLTAEAKKKATELARVAENFENLLTAFALKRWPLERFAPLPASLAEIRRAMQDDDLVIAWVETEKSLLGIAINKNTEESWRVDDRAAALQHIQQLLAAIGVPGQAKRDEQEVREAVQLSAAALSKLLLPENIRTMTQAANRLIIVPSGNLWYLPFEVLPDSDALNPAPLLARHRITYLPTIGSIQLIVGAAPNVVDTAGVVGSFFSNNRATNAQMSDSLVQVIPNSQRIDLTQKLPALPTHWLRLRADQLWVAADSPFPKNPWDLRILPFNGNRDNVLGSWLQSPLKSPARVILCGMHSSAEAKVLAGGNELFLPACTLLSSGTRAAILTRWPVGGRSTQIALARLLEELQFESPSAAWQRSAIALWAEQLPAEDEPALPPAIRNGTALVDGDYSLLWSGYFLVGDHEAPKPP